MLFRGPSSTPGSRSAEQAFTIVEVMMAAVILVVGFMGMIQAITLGSEMMATARRQTLAAQIIEHEIGQLRMQSWAAIYALPSSSSTLGATWSASTSYAIGDTATYSGAWYRCISANSGQTPTNATYWKVDSPPYASLMTTAGAALGTTYTLTRTTSDVTTDLKEVVLTLTWTKGGTTTAAATPTGSWLNKLSFYQPSSIARTYTRKSTAYFGKYGLNLSLQRS